MASPKISKNDSFYQLACHTTDTFTSCIRIYETLLSYFEAETPGNVATKRLFNIGGMLTILYNELNTLKNEITTAVVVDDDYGGDDVSESVVESKDPTELVSEHNRQENLISEHNQHENPICETRIVEHQQENLISEHNQQENLICETRIVEHQQENLISEHNQQENPICETRTVDHQQENLISEHNQQENPICETRTVEHQQENLISENNQQENPICEAGTVERTVFHNEEVLKKLPIRSWEDVGQVPDEAYQEEKVKDEDNNMEQKISLNGKMHVKPTENLKTQASDFGYVCGNCNESITVYNQDLDLSFALHNQDGSCRGKPSKPVEVQKEIQKEKVSKVSAQGQVHNLSKYQGATDKTNLTLGTKYKARDNLFSCIQPVGNNYICTVCDKMLSGPKIFREHVLGNYHQSLLKDSVVQEQTNPSLYGQLANIIKSLSHSLNSQKQYLSVGKDYIMCNLCNCKIPPTVTNVTDHVLGSRHSKNETELLSVN